jgi:predicted RNase H-like HicB family nuclease
MLEYRAAYYEIEDGWFMAKVLDFPGVVTQGKTLAAAKKMLRSALEDMAEWYLEDGQLLPKPNPKAKDKKAKLLEPITLRTKAVSGAGS